MTAPDDPLLKSIEAFIAAKAAADRLQLTSFPLGYNVMVSAGTEITYHVRRIDHLSYPTRDFSSVAEVEAHLDHLATLPRYRLDLVGDRQVREKTDEDQPFTTIIDATTGEAFNVRGIDIEASTFLHIHAEDPPTVNWHLDP